MSVLQLHPHLAVDLARGLELQLRRAVELLLLAVCLGALAIDLRAGLVVEVLLPRRDLLLQLQQALRAQVRELAATAYLCERLVERLHVVACIEDQPGACI